MIEQIIPLVVGILGGIVKVLQDNDVHPAISDSLSVLETVLAESPDVVEDLKELREEVAELAAQGKNPSNERLDALQTAATSAIDRIRAAAEAKRLAEQSEEE